MNEYHCVTRCVCVCVFLLHTVLKHSLLKIGHRYHPGNFKEKSNCPPNANTSSENACAFLIKAHMHSGFQPTGVGEELGSQQHPPLWRLVLHPSIWALNPGPSPALRAKAKGAPVQKLLPKDKNPERKFSC